MGLIAFPTVKPLSKIKTASLGGSAAAIALVLCCWKTIVPVEEGQAYRVYEQRTPIQRMMDQPGSWRVVTDPSGQIVQHGPLSDGVPDGRWDVWRGDRHASIEYRAGFYQPTALRPATTSALPIEIMHGWQRWKPLPVIDPIVMENRKPRLTLEDL